MKNNSGRALILSLFLLSALSCSVSSYLKEGEVLYTGIKKIEIEGKPSKPNKDEEAALLALEKTLAYPPNNALFGSSKQRWPLPPIRLWTYMALRNDSSWLARTLRKLGSPPVLLSQVNPSLRAKVAEHTLMEYGYLRAKVSSEVYPNPADSLESKVGYTAHLGELFRIDSIKPLEPFALPDSSLFSPQQYATLKKGDAFTVDALGLNRQAISREMRNRGFYYFRPDFIEYRADTLLRPTGVTLFADYAPAIPKGVLSPWRIGRIEVRAFGEPEATTYGEEVLTDSVQILQDSLVVYYNGSLPVRKGVLDRRIRLRPGMLYRQEDEERTLQALSNLGAFSSTEFIFTPRISKDSIERRLDLTMLLRPDRPWDLSLEALFKVKSTDFIGPGVNVTLGRRNIFGGGEQLSLSLKGAYEWQWGKSIFGRQSSSLNSYQLGGEMSLVFPAILFPGKIDSYYSYPSSTSISLSGSVINRAQLYRQRSLGFSMNYHFRPKSWSYHEITPFNVSFSLLSRTTEAFQQLVEQNPVLGLTLQNQFIPQLGYSYTYDNAFSAKRPHHLWMRFSISEAGNLLSTALLLAGRKWGDVKQLFGVPYAQFVKGTAEWRYTYTIDRNQSLATRLYTGAIYAFGNSEWPPYMEQFYIGGANSIRAFSVRSIGPGRFIPRSDSPYSFMDQVGDVRLEANIEYRGRLWNQLHGAIFLDAGNIWLLRKDPHREGASFSEIGGVKDFLNQIAVGTGVGLRYDLEMLVLRLDAGLGLHVPFQTSRRGWYNIPKLGDVYSIHLAIGYPF